MNDKNTPIMTKEEVEKLLAEAKSADISDFVEEGPDGVLRLNRQIVEAKGIVRKFSSWAKSGRIRTITLINGQSVQVDENGVVVKVNHKRRGG